jgi:hypothetical protein
MNDSNPQIKIEIIEGSVRCYVLGLCSLLPVIGIPLSLIALTQCQRVKQMAGSQWNPAHRQLRRGSLFAWLGLVATALEIGLVAIILINNPR